MPHRGPRRRHALGRHAARPIFPTPKPPTRQILDDLEQWVPTVSCSSSPGSSAAITDTRCWRRRKRSFRDAGRRASRCSWVTLEPPISVRRRLGPRASSLDYVKAKGLAPSSVQIRFGFDPLGAMASRGLAPKPWTELGPFVAGRIAELAAPRLHRPLRRCRRQAGPRGGVSRHRSSPSCSPIRRGLSARAKEAAGIPVRHRATLHLLPARRGPGPVSHHR